MYKVIKECKKEVVVFLTANIIWAGIGILLAFILGFITETALNNISGRQNLIIILCLTYVLLDMGFEFAANYSQILLRTKIIRIIRDKIVERIQSCSIEEKEENGDAYYLSLINNNVQELDSSYIYGILMIIFQVISLIFALVATMTIQPILTLIIVIFSALPLIVPRLLREKLENLNREAMVAKSKYLNFLNEFLEGFVLLKVFDRKAELLKRHGTINNRTTEIINKNAKWKRASMSISYGMGNLVIVGSWTIGIIFVLNGSINLPQLISLTTLMNMVAGPFQIISEYYAGIVSGKAIKEDLFSFINSASKSGIIPKSNINEMELIDVSVEKKEKLILKKINMKITEGDKIAIIGRSGSGKSTLLRVTAGIIQPKQGEIKVNNKLADTINQIGNGVKYFPQQTVIFSGTIAENVTIFKDKSNVNIKNIVNKAGLSQWLNHYKDDVDQYIEKANSNLSGGELKRMDFARILLDEGNVLLLDEPTSGLDIHYSDKIMETICSWKNKTILVATHDISVKNLKRFDKIIYIENGNIVLEGNSAEMLDSKEYNFLKGNIDNE